MNVFEAVKQSVTTPVSYTHLDVYKRQGGRHRKEPDPMEHSDELTFAEYFKSRYDLFRGLISFVVAMQWLIDHDFAEPTDRDARLMDIEVSRQMCDVWGELYVLTLREWLDGQ